ncbi:MAG: hypothetical protein EB027_00780 [Actinobacteria bacterium]|nr:hypothetical protein [Actinomycetota bacterium]
MGASRRSPPSPKIRLTHDSYSRSVSLRACGRTGSSQRKDIRLVATAVAEPQVFETEDSAAPAIIGRSPAELAWRRFKRDRVGVVALIVSLFCLAVSALAVPIVRLMGLNPYVLNQSRRPGPSHRVQGAHPEPVAAGHRVRVELPAWLPRRYLRQRGRSCH